MRGPAAPTDAHVVLSAVQAASEGDLDALLRIIEWRRDVLSDDLAYRLLLSFYPTEVSEHSALVDFLKSLQRHSETPGTPTLDPSISSLSSNEATRRCRTLVLRAIPVHTSISTESNLANFVIEWAKRLEQIDGTTQPAAEFVEQFLEQDADLALWYETYLVPLLRLQYEFYPDVDDVITLDEIESLSATVGTRTLLKYAKRQHQPSSLARDLEQVVSPWVHGANRAKRRKVVSQPEMDTVEDGSWEPVYDWLLSSSLNDFEVTAKAYIEWSGPLGGQESTDEAARHAQVGLGMIYGCSQASTEAHAICGQVLDKAAGVVGFERPHLSQTEPDIPLPADDAQDLNEADLLANSLRRTANAFTSPTQSSFQRLTGLLTTAKILSGHGLRWTTGDLARTTIFGSERRHKDELRRLLHQIASQTRREIDWRSVRQQILWLHSWRRPGQQAADHPRPGFFSQLSLDYVETQLLDALLKAAQYNVVKEIYLTTASPPLSPEVVEVRIVAAIYEAYDNASNGNRDRGGIKRANDLLKAFRTNFTQASTLSDIDYLIRATHSLSFYQLTLQHGVPFKPVAIRVQKDPLCLLEKVLEQDSRAYTKLDDLLEIGRNLVRAHLPNGANGAEGSEPLEVGILNAEHRITYAAIMAALATNDFDTAYAYITTRLHIATEQSVTYGVTDDTSWRAAYAAGRYRPSTSPKSLTGRIDSLTQRMELLSRALMLAPPGEALSGILATWRRYEEELDGLKTQAVEEERAFDARAKASLPGAFGVEDREADADETKQAMARRAGPSQSGPSYEEEAPLGLFDVARGAASALRKSAAFPLGSTGLRDLKISSGATAAQDTQREEASSPTSDDGRRVRKRDMVANMVGSGLGWVLGAQPQDRVDH
ncbi:hypothetical protein H2200_008531 [Cladophialophora chaetospira]|uniref:Sec39 domain-containing protein n=1 Tax=Cladophialophora chaetospira TaxID=386627 RepID=A0AA38X5Y8_9EURO|nr:hypothetical protein H2200_008531 [Cladophialophora chaetospira]